VNARRSARGVVEVLGGVGEALGQRGHDPVELGRHGVGVGLVEDGAHLGGHVRLRRFRHAVSRLRQVMDAATLPSGAGQSRPDRRDQTRVGVADHQLHPGQAAGYQPAQKRQPARAVLGRGQRPGRGAPDARRR
jgi:hypothetical protein